MGSSTHPYKGLLDQLAQQAYADGTNAWTSQDHTTYTMTVGQSAALDTLLPMYLDHVFFPLLEEHQFLTEVHGVNGDNVDIGVVFCEMQGMERKLGTMAYHQLMQLVFPGTNGYNSETGGLMKDIMSPQMNMDEIRKYHKAVYRPDNCIVLICGSSLSEERVFHSLSEMDQRLAALVKDTKIERPFSKPLDPLVPQVVHMDFPSDSELFGRVDVGFRLGNIKQFRDFYTSAVVLSDYLSDGIASDLYVALVDLPEPYCRSVSFEFDLFKEVSFSVQLDGVPVAKLEEAAGRVMEVFRDLYKKGTIDVDRMRNVIESSLLEDKSEFESDPAETLQDNVGVCFLYFEPEDLPDIVFGEQRRLQELLSRSSDHAYWMQVLKKMILDVPHITLICRPSTSKQQSFLDEDDKLLADRAAALGEEGLKKAGEEVDKAIELTSRPCPPEVLRQLKKKVFGEVNHDSFHKLATWRCGAPPYEEHRPDWLAAHLHPLEELPFAFFEADHYAKTDFADLDIFMTFDEMTPEDLVFAELFTEVMFAAPLKDIPDHLQVAVLIRKDLLSESCSVGLAGGSSFQAGNFPHTIRLNARAKVENYSKAVHWMRRCVFESVFDSERLLVAYNALVSRLDEYSRSPHKVEGSILYNTIFADESLDVLLSLKNQKKFLKKFGKMLKKRPEKAVKQFNKFLEWFRSPVRTYSVLVHVTADFRRVPNPHSAWCSWPFPEAKTRFPWVLPASANLKRAPFKKRIVEVATLPIDSANACECWIGPSFKDKDDIAPLFCLTELLSAMESTLWVAVRGAGLAYHINLSMEIEKGLVTLDISEAANGADLAEALRVSHEILSKKTKDLIDEEALMTGKAISIGTVLSRMETHQRVSRGRFISVSRGYSSSWLIDQLQKVTTQDLMRVWKKYIRKAMKRSVLIVTLSEAEEQDFREALAEE